MQKMADLLKMGRPASDIHEYLPTRKTHPTKKKRNKKKKKKK
jgi:hypothetical protein